MPDPTVLMAPADSILNTTKKLLGIPAENTEFDHDIITYVNSIFSTLWQLGVGPDMEFSITDENAVWPEFIGDTEGIDSVRSYMANKVRLMFDPPSSAAAIEAVKGICSEFEWRLNVRSEEARTNGR